MIGACWSAARAGSIALLLAGACIGPASAALGGDAGSAQFTPGGTGPYFAY